MVNLLNVMHNTYRGVVDAVETQALFDEDRKLKSLESPDDDWKVKARNSLGKSQKAVLKVISQQTIECAYFIRDAAKAKNFCWYSHVYY